MAIHTNTERGWLFPIWLSWFAENRGPLWAEWGVMNFGFRVLWWWLKVRVAIGTKTNVIPRWMRP